MHKLDLQLFSEAVQGKKIIYLFRPLSAASTSSGTALAFTTENGRTKSKDADSTATKDGAIRTPGVAETEITATCIMADDDTMIAALEAAMESGGLIEIWEANLEKAGSTTGTYKGTYFQGYLTELEINSNAEDFVECSLTFGINGSGKAGDVTVTEQQQAIADYVFRDSTQATGE